MKFFKKLRGNALISGERLSKKSRRKGNGRNAFYELQDGGPRRSCWFNHDRQVFVDSVTLEELTETSAVPAKEQAHNCPKLAVDVVGSESEQRSLSTREILYF